jgi:hypothetical protein
LILTFEQAEDRLTHLFIGTAPIPERKALRREVQALPGVINVWELMTGHKNLHIKAVGENTADLTQLAQTISELGIEIEDETLLEAETHTPYDSFGPDGEVPASDPTDVISLPGDAQVVDVTVQAGAPIVDQTIEEAVKEGLLDEDSLVIAIERGSRMVTPTGTTNVRPDDIVTVLFRGGDRILSTSQSSVLTTAPQTNVSRNSVVEEVRLLILTANYYPSDCLVGTNGVLIGR